MQYSLIVCTYNPLKDIFSRVLSSLLNLDTRQLSVECIIVDNRSSNGFTSEPYFKEFLANAQFDVKVVTEEKAGLTYARLKGFSASSGETIVFVDDDNYMGKDYLMEIRKLHETMPYVYCWGPGTVEVEFTGDPEEWVNNFRWLFQQKKMLNNEYGFSRNWTFFSPPGTGLVVKRSVMQKYAELYSSGTFKALDRNGASLASGGDSQIIHASTLLGHCCGLSPQLKVIHLIDERKSNLKYMKRLLYNVNSAIHVHAEAFPELSKRLVKIPSKLEYIFFIISTLFNNKLRLRSPHFILAMAGYLGIINGSYIILNKEMPSQFRFWVKRLKLD